MKLLGSFVYTPDNVLYRGLALSGDTLTLRSDHGAVSPRDGKLDIPVMELAGRGSPLGRVLQYFGVSGQAGEAQTKFRLGGRIIRPEASRGEFTVKDLDLFGRKLDEITTDFALHDGTCRCCMRSAGTAASAAMPRFSCLPKMCRSGPTIRCCR